jgi:hypothetical protein
LSYIGYQKFARNREQVAAVSPGGPGANKVPLTHFLTSLKVGKTSIREAHQELYAYLQTLNKSNFPSNQELKNLTETNDIPHDYLYFFKDCLPAYGRSLGSPSATLTDPHIVLSLPRQRRYKASIFLNKNGLPVESIGPAVNPQGSPNRIVLSGAYTSPFNLPAGLTIDQGITVNPALQDFDGLLQIWPDGHLQISHIEALQDSLKTLHIRTEFVDYLKFIQLAEQAKLTVIQANLLVNNGEVLVKDDRLLKKLQRRILFETADGGLHIYDSLDKEETLFESAQYLKDHFRAERALNLEAGSYSFCTINRDNHLTNRSNVKVGTILSNFIVIDF